jgi:hypothetical protein
MTNRTAEYDGRFMAGYCSNLPSGFWLSYAVSKPQWQVWHLFSKLIHTAEREKAYRNNNGDNLPYLPYVFRFRLK